MSIITVGIDLAKNIFAAVPLFSTLRYLNLLLNL